jgi:hypothetical protein
MINLKMSDEPGRYEIKQIGSLPAPFKLTGLTVTKYGIFTGVCNDYNRNTSRLYLGAELIYGQDGRPNCETIGKGLILGDYVGWAGEHGRVVVYDRGFVSEMNVVLKFASALAYFRGQPIVFNTDGGISALHCVTGRLEFTLPGRGIVTSTAILGDKLYASVVDGDENGLACSDGSFIPMGECRCVFPAAGDIYCTKGSVIYRKDGNRLVEMVKLPCEVIMDVHQDEGGIWIAGSNPDQLWVLEPDGLFVKVVEFSEGNKHVGGSLFRVRVSSGVFGRSPGGNSTAVYSVKRKQGKDGSD